MLKFISEQFGPCKIKFDDIPKKFRNGVSKRLLVKELEEYQKNYLTPSFIIDHDLSSFTQEDLDQLLKSNTFKNIILLNYADSIKDKFSLIGNKVEIFNIVKKEDNISDDDEKKYEEVNMNENGINVRYVIEDMLKIKEAKHSEEKSQEELTMKSLLDPSSSSSSSSASALGAVRHSKLI